MIKPRRWIIYVVGWCIVFPMYLWDEVKAAWSFSKSTTQAEIDEMMQAYFPPNPKP